VLWRKRCFGTQSERGNLFAERLMTVAHTARKQRKDVLAFLTACCQRSSTAPARRRCSPRRRPSRGSTAVGAEAERAIG